MDFDLDSFEDFLVEKKVKYGDRPDLVLKIRTIMNAEKKKGKVNGKSCVSWRIKNYQLDKEDLVVDGEATEVEVKEITDGS